MYTKTPPARVDDHPSRRGSACLSRRTLLAGSVGLLPVAAIAACGGRVDCSDAGGLTAEDMTARREHHYVETSPDPAKACTQCEQWTAGADARSCGGCKVLKGPINPSGNCDLFAKRA